MHEYVTYFWLSTRTTTKILDRPLAPFLLLSPYSSGPAITDTTMLETPWRRFWLCICSRTVFSTLGSVPLRPSSGLSAEGFGFTGGRGTANGSRRLRGTTGTDNGEVTLWGLPWAALAATDSAMFFASGLDACLGEALAAVSNWKSSVHMPVFSTGPAKKKKKKYPSATLKLNRYYDFF
jgi:hypothetical protein